jgi:ATP-dependent exoDNAse (exonuclease V) beta subunit
MPEITDFESGGEAQTIITSPDKACYDNMAAHFMKEYKYSQSVNLPVKSSASSLLKLHGEDEAYFAENVLVPYDETDGTSAERGTAYHRFLELCDFGVCDEDGIKRQLDNFVADGLMPQEQAALLNVNNLCKILSMPAFKGLVGAHLLREQEFLVKLPANEFLPTDADDGVLLQGAIDLLAIGNGGTAIIDYKYSKKSDEHIIKTYTPQLSLYKKAVSRILSVDESTISTTIINIYALREIPLNL